MRFLVALKFDWNFYSELDELGRFGVFVRRRLAWRDDTNLPLLFDP